MATSFKHRASTRAGAGREAPRASLYEEVTQRIIAELEAGRFPWVQPWSAAAPGLPANAVTGRRYSGINILLLWEAATSRGYPSQRWLTFRQAYVAGGSVRCGEHGVTVYYADRFVPFARGTDRAGAGKGGKTSGRGTADADTRAGRSPARPARAASGGECPDGRDGDDEKTPASIPFLKRFTLFNVAQCEGLPEAVAGGGEAPLGPVAPVPAAEALIAATGAEFRIGGDRAFYDVTGDFVRVPPQAAFHEPINYYRTALHELGHWTGHETRLRRDQSGGFGSPAYAREELVAEMASAFLCASLGIVPTVRHADYVGAWLEVLRADARAIFRAASAASKAADYLLAFMAPQASDPASQAGG